MLSTGKIPRARVLCVCSHPRRFRLHYASGQLFLYRLLNAPSTGSFHSEEEMQMSQTHVNELLTKENQATQNHSKKSYLRAIFDDLPLRIFSIAWLLFCFFFTTYWSTEIQARATLSKLERQIESLDDLVQVSLYEADL